MSFFSKAMAAAGGVRRALAGLPSASRPPIAGTFFRQAAAQSSAFEAAASLPCALRRRRAISSPPAEGACLLFLVPLRGASSFASEQIDGEYHHEWGAQYGMDYGESHSKHPTSHPNHQLQPDLPSAGSSTGVDRNQCIDAGVNVNAQHSYNLEQPYRSGGSYGFPNNHQQYSDARANSGKPGSNVRQLYGSGSAYGQQSPSGDLPSGHQLYSGVQANNWLSGYGKGQTHHEPNGYGMYNSGFKIPSNQPCYDGEKTTYGQNGYGSSGQSYQSTTRNDQQVFHRQKDIDQKHDGIYPNMPGNSCSQYANPSGFYEEYVAGFQQGPNGSCGYDAPQGYHSPYVNNQVDAQCNHQGYSMKFNSPHGIYQEKRSGFQPTASNGNNLNSGPYQDGSSTEVSHETSVFGKCKGTVEELDKLCEDDKVKEALEVLALLQENGIGVGAPQYFKLMQACGDAATLAEARIIHNKITRSALDVNTDVNNKILEMYVRCGSMEDAKKLFSGMGHQNLTSWNTMISGFVNNGLGEEAIDFFDQFKQMGDKPDSGMFVHLFLACGILGSVDEGMLHFESMQKDFGITPTMEHYVSIVNMLGQSGYIDEAREFVEWMPVEPSIDVWETLMNMCRLNGFSGLGDRCVQIIECLGPSRLNEQSKMGLFPVNASDLAKEKERKKANAVEVRSKVHEYRAGDRSHPEHPKIYEELRYLAAHMKEAGYIADTRFVLHDVDHETKEDALLAHSERLAVGYGLITSAARSPIRVIKNLRSCGDCHTALKIISKLVGRQIIARDAKRFHHFENGLCSCKDYW